MAALGSPAVLLAFLTLLCIATALFVWALYPRRRGATPHCRRCNYNLTGTDRMAARPRCPECGADITSERAIVHGERHRRPWLIGAALLLTVIALAASAFTGFHWARSVDWYRWKPTAWVIGDAASIASLRAIQELNRRYDAKAVSESKMPALADVALTEHASTVARSATTSLAADLLGKMLRDGRLPDDQISRFLDNLGSFTATVRQPLVEGMDAVVIVNSTIPTPTKMLTTWRILDHSVDQAPQRGVAGFGWSSLGGSPPRNGPIRLRSLSAGNHLYASRIEVRIFDSDKPGTRPDKPLAEKSIALRVAFSIPPGNPADHIVGIDSPDLRDEYHNAIEVTQVALGDCDQRYGSYPVEIEFPISRRLPFWLLAHGELEAYGRRYPLSGISVEPTAEPRNWKLSGHVRDELPDRVTVILNCRRDWAERAADYSEYVAGEIRFEDIPVIRVAPATESQPVPRP